MTGFDFFEVSVSTPARKHPAEAAIHGAAHKVRRAGLNIFNGLRGRRRMTAHLLYRVINPRVCLRTVLGKCAVCAVCAVGARRLHGEPRPSRPPRPGRCPRFFPAPAVLARSATHPAFYCGRRRFAASWAVAENMVFEVPDLCAFCAVSWLTRLSAMQCYQ